MNKNKKGILLALCLVLAVPVCGSGLPAQATSMSSITSDSIREKQDQINQAQKERETMKSNLSNLEQIKKDLETKKSNLKSYVAQLDQNLSEIEQNIADLKSQITAKEEEITQTQEELDAAQAKEDAQKDAMIRRIRVMYEKGDSYILDMMLKAESFSDFLNRADFMDLVMAYDRQQWKEFMENRKYIALCKEELEAEKQILDEAKAGVEQEQANMEALIDQKSRDITAYESDISNKEQAIKEEVSLSLIGGSLKKMMPKFKVKRYGCKTLGKLYERLERYELVMTEKGVASAVRMKGRTVRQE